MGRSSQESLRRLQEVRSWLREMEEEGALYGADVLQAPAGEWRKMMASDRRYRSYGTLMFLLGQAHENLERTPQDSYELVAAILPFAERVDAPEPMYRDTVRGLAWKERGNTLFSRDLREAKRAALKSIEIFGRYPTLAEDLAKAQLLLAKVHREQGDSTEALLLVERAAATFNQFSNSKYYGISRFIQAWIYFSLKQFRAAYDILVRLVEDAERQGDELSLARVLHFAATCARELGEHDEARELRARSVKYFERVSAPAELPRVRWEHAIALASDGQTSEAIFELYRVRQEFLRFGMIVSAACASLDITRIKFDRGEDVTSTAAELVTTFAEAGLTPNAIEALAYIREEARAQTLTMPKIDAAKNFFKSLERQPVQAQLFVPPRGEEL